MADILDLFLHLDVHLQAVIAAYGVWTYVILFLGDFPGNRCCDHAILTRGFVTLCRRNFCCQWVPRGGLAVSPAVCGRRAR